MSLIRWYRMNGNIIDAMGNSELVNSGTSTAVAGKIGQAMRKTSGYYLTDLTNIPDNLSISLWYKHNGATWASECIFGTRLGNNGFMLYRNASDTAGYYRAYFWYNSTSSTIVGYNKWPGISGLSPDTWYHLVMTRDSLGNFRLYKDGTLIYNGSPPSDFVSWNNNGATLAFHAQGNGSGYTAGDISFNDVRIYDHALSPKEVKELAKAKVLHYKFDESGDKFYDCSSYGVEPLEGAVATLRPYEGKFGGAVAVEEGTKNRFTNPSFNTPNANGGWSHWGTSGVNGSYGQTTDKKYIYGNQQYAHWVANAADSSSYYLCYQSPTLNGQPSYRSLTAILCMEDGSEVTNDKVFPTANSTTSQGAPNRQWTSIKNIPGTIFYVCKWEGFHQSGTNDLVGICVSQGYKVYISFAQLEDKPFATSFTEGIRPDGILAYPVTLKDDYTIACYRKSHTDEDYKHIVKRSDGTVFVDGVENSEYDVGWIAGRNLVKRGDTLYGWQGEKTVNTSSGAFIHTRNRPINAVYQVEVRTDDENLLGAEFGWQWSSKVQGNTVILSNEWQRVVSPYFDADVAIGLRCIGGTGVLELRNIKVERGSTATHWTPAPEDLGYDVDILMLSNQTGLIDELKIYATALSDVDVLELYQTRANLDSHGNLYIDNEIIETGHKPLIMDYTIWEDGQTGAIGSFTLGAGNNLSNSRILGQDPWGKQTVLWRSYGENNTAAGIYFSSSTPVDNTKMYRMSWWEKRVSNGIGNQCRHYAGLNGYGATNGVYSRSSGSLSTNPYFWSTASIPTQEQLPLGEWILVVGHVWPAGSGTGDKHLDSGRYTINGKIGDISNDWVWHEDTTRGRSRTLTIYREGTGVDNTGALHYTVYPRMDVCDGSEPSIQDLLNGFDSRHIDYVRSKGGSNPITIDVGDQSSMFGNISELGPMNGIIGWWPLDGHTQDYSGNNNHGTNNGATITSGIRGSAYSFDGSSSYIRANNILSQGSPFSISFWTKVFGTSNQCLGCTRTATGNGMSIFIISNKIRFDTDHQWTTGYTVPRNEWIHITLTQDHSGKRLYVNAILEDSTSSTGSMSNLSDIFQIGASHSNGSSLGNYLDGIVCDYRIYNRALSPEEIKSLYDATKPNAIPMQLSNDGTVYLAGELKEA
jgi:hypothetical protein